MFALLYILTYAGMCLAVIRCWTIIHRFISKWNELQPKGEPKTTGIKMNWLHIYKINCKQLVWKCQRDVEMWHWHWNDTQKSRFRFLLKFFFPFEMTSVEEKKSHEENVSDVFFDSVFLHSIPNRNMLIFGLCVISI